MRGRRGADACWPCSTGALPAVFGEESDGRPPDIRGGVARLESELGKEPLVLALGVPLLEELLDRLARLSPLGRVGDRIRGDAGRLEVDFD
mmetsp:Transcript_48573/g.101493  ORF Transcript_48573/g.101493 Transcript_48573/m.101493 type:complete len:91 (+) Transcript_48573:150-422(+)